jgi:hypothetical protein
MDVPPEEMTPHYTTGVGRVQQTAIVSRLSGAAGTVKIPLSIGGEEMRPDFLQFGYGPRSWAIAGVFVCLAGLVALFFGGVILWPLAEHEAPLSVGGTILGVGCVLFGMLFTVDGLLLVTHRKRLKITISDEAVHIGRLWRTDDIIAFRDIRRVRSGSDCVLLEVRNRKLLYRILDSYFNSMRERTSFIEELSERICNDKTTAHA